MFFDLCREHFVSEIELTDFFALEVEYVDLSHGVAPRSALDLDVDARRKVELHQRVEGLGRRLQNVDETLVGSDFELLTRLLVDVRTSQHGVATNRGRQRNRAGHARARAASGLDDVG